MSTHAPRPMGPSTPPAGSCAPASTHACSPCSPSPGHRAPPSPVIVGATYAPPAGAPSPDRLAEAARSACTVHAGSGHRPLPVGTTLPEPVLIVRPQVLGGGGTTIATAVLAEPSPGLVQQIAGRLAALLTTTSAKLAALAALTGEAKADARPADAGASQPQAQPVPPRVPMQPPAPVLTIDPTLGTIVPADPDGAFPLGAAPGGRDGDVRNPPLPTSWVPVTLGSLRGIAHSGRDGVLRAIGRIDDVLDDLGMTRLQLLALTILGPAAVAILLAFVSSLLDGA